MAPWKGWCDDNLECPEHAETNMADSEYPLEQKNRNFFLRKLSHLIEGSKVMSSKKQGHWVDIA